MKGDSNIKCPVCGENHPEWAHDFYLKLKEKAEAGAQKGDSQQ